MARQPSKPSSPGDREIRVEVSGAEGSSVAGGEPKAFTVAGRRHGVAEGVSTWPDESFGGGYRRDAWLGHQRLFYRVRTEAGELFDIYFDLGESRRRRKSRWVLHRRLPAAAGPAATEPPAAPTTEEQPAVERQA